MNKRQVKEIIKDEIKKILELTTTDNVAGYKVPMKLSGPITCECPECGFQTASEEPCNRVKCPNCGVRMEDIE